jgi:predicted  nucleic acid-binding Zn-ribbon protein
MPSPRSSSRRARADERPRVSAALEVIGELELANSLSALEARLASLELDVARAAALRDEEARRLAGEMQVMRARVDDALGAVTEVAEELRAAWAGLDQRIAELVDARFAEQARAVEALRAQVSSGLEAARLAIQEAEARLQGELEALSGTSLEQVRGVSELVEQARARVDEAVASVEGRMAELLAGARLGPGGLDDQVRGVEARLRDEALAREKRVEERLAELADRVAALARTFDGLAGKMAGAEARLAGGRAGTEASVAVLTQQVRALESRLAELSETVASTATEKVQAMAGQVAEVREAILRVAERVGQASFLTRRVADLEIRLAELAARLDRPGPI